MELGLHLDLSDFCVAIQLGLGVDTSGGGGGGGRGGGLSCPHCNDIDLDPLGHHAVMCRARG